jgi:hypothetical protein
MEDESYLSQSDCDFMISFLSLWYAGMRPKRSSADPFRKARLRHPDAEFGGGEHENFEHLTERYRTSQVSIVFHGKVVNHDYVVSDRAFCIPRIHMEIPTYFEGR